MPYRDLLFLISDYRHDSGLLPGPSAVLTEAEMASWA